MKAKFIFDLSDMDDKEDFEIHCKASDNSNAIWEVRQKIREWRKYRSQQMNHEQYIVVEKLLDELNELLPDES